MTESLMPGASRPARKKVNSWLRGLQALGCILIVIICIRLAGIFDLRCQTVESHAGICFAGIILGLTLTAILCFPKRALLLGSSSKYSETERKKWLGILGVLGAVSCLWMVPFQLANYLLDRSEPKCHDRVLMAKSISVGKSKSHYLEVRSWTPEANLIRFKVTGSFYEEVVPKVTMMRICTQPGAFGWEWIQSWWGLKQPADNPALKNDVDAYLEQVRQILPLALSKHTRPIPQGSVFLDFVVAQDGRLLSLKVIRSNTTAGKQTIDDVMTLIKAIDRFPSFSSTMAKELMQVNFTMMINIEP